MTGVQTCALPICYNMPQTVTTQLESSPLSALAGAGSLLTGMFTPGAGGITPAAQMGGALSGFGNWLGGLFSNNPYGSSGTASTIDAASPD